jgi:Peptidase propeptide and YPEB domain
MIDAKQAVTIAKQRAADWLGTGISNLEEVELDKYKNREVWSITLSVPRDLTVLSPLAQIGADPLQYKRFLIDAQTGELVAMKLREPSPQ